MDNFSGKNQFPRINCDTPKLQVSFDTTEEAQKEGAPVRLIGNGYGAVLDSSTIYPFGFILHGALVGSTQSTICSYGGDHEILGVASESIGAGTLVSVGGYDETKGKGIYSSAKNGHWVCGVVTKEGNTGEVITIRTQSPFQFFVD